MHVDKNKGELIVDSDEQYSFSQNFINETLLVSKRTTVMFQLLRDESLETTLALFYTITFIFERFSTSYTTFIINQFVVVYTWAELF